MLIPIKCFKEVFEDEEKQIKLRYLDNKIDEYAKFQNLHQTKKKRSK